MSERFTDRLRSLADDIWQAQHMHPFVRGIGTATVDREQFKHWVRQDYLFLIEYGRLLALAAARAPDLDTMRRFADLTQSTLGTEMDLHRSYAADFGISDAELEAEAMSPTTRAYTDFLLRSAAVGDYVELVAALLPCMWGFSEIGRELERAGVPADPLCAKWIEMYASEDFAALADWCRDLLDDLAEHLPAQEQERLAEVFLTSSRYELKFWDMARDLERWPAVSP
jgi:thiaminase/transcriptional activator TenA